MFFESASSFLSTNLVLLHRSSNEIFPYFNANMKYITIADIIDNFECMILFILCYKKVTAIFKIDSFINYQNLKYTKQLENHTIYSS